MTWAEKVRFKLRTVHTEMAELRRYIQERGLPDAIRTDVVLEARLWHDGLPFASPNGLYNLSKLSV